MYIGNFASNKSELLLNQLTVFVRIGIVPPLELVTCSHVFSPQLPLNQTCKLSSPNTSATIQNDSSRYFRPKKTTASSQAHRRSLSWDMVSSRLSCGYRRLSSAGLSLLTSPSSPRFIRISSRSTTLYRRTCIGTPSSSNLGVEIRCSEISRKDMINGSSNIINQQQLSPARRNLDQIQSLLAIYNIRDWHMQNPKPSSIFRQLSWRKA